MSFASPSDTHEPLENALSVLSEQRRLEPVHVLLCPSHRPCSSEASGRRQPLGAVATDARISQRADRGARGCEQSRTHDTCEFRCLQVDAERRAKSADQAKEHKPVAEKKPDPPPRNPEKKKNKGQRARGAGEHRPTIHHEGKQQFVGRRNCIRGRRARAPFRTGTTAENADNTRRFLATAAATAAATIIATQWSNIVAIWRTEW
jgi:hypothetical protein